MLNERGFLLLLAIIATLTLLLSTTGIHALMAFTVTQRTREIGIRSALGADPSRIVRGVFGPALRQFAIGTATGGVICISVSRRLLPASVETADQGDAWLTVAGVIVLLIAAGLVGCLVPVRRGLRVQPTEARRAEG